MTRTHATTHRNTPKTVWQKTEWARNFIICDFASTWSRNHRVSRTELLSAQTNTSIITSTSLTLSDLYSLALLLPILLPLLFLLPLPWCRIISKHNHWQVGTNPSPPPPSRSNWMSNLSRCCVQVEKRTASTACSLFRSLSTAHICIDLSSFWAGGTGGSNTKTLIPIDLHRALRGSLVLHLIVGSYSDWNRATAELSEDIMLLSEHFWLCHKICVCVCFSLV